MAFPKFLNCPSIDEISQSDLLIFLSLYSETPSLKELKEALTEVLRFDPRARHQATVFPIDIGNIDRCLYVPVDISNEDFASGRTVFNIGKSIGQLLNDLDSKHPSIYLDDSLKQYLDSFCLPFETLSQGLCHELWQPLEARECIGESKLETVQSVTLLGANAKQVDEINALEAGKRLARDLCGTEPERMAPIGFAAYCEQAFKDSAVSYSAVDNLSTIERDYPCLYAVARASVEVARHQPRVIRLEYQSEGPIEETIFLAGKGITYDTGGADLKVNGAMAGMSRDKGGAASVAGLMKTLSILKPKNVRVVALIGAVRNSIGADAYVPDEIITAHSGIRVRVGNTDAEGRMVLTDLLSHLRQEALQAKKAKVFSVATLTGHALLALGPYTALIENKVALSQGVARLMSAAGEEWADPCEQSLLRQEDFDFIQAKTKADDVLSSNNKPSVSTVRGHQFPAAFLSVASGISEYGLQSELAIAYTHVDIAGSGVEGMDWQHGKPMGAAIAALYNGIVAKIASQ